MSEKEFSKSELDQMKNGIAQALGIKPEEIKTRQADWVNLMKQGVLVGLHLRRWRATTTLTADHLGLTFEDQAEEEAFSKTMRLGQVYLLPKKYIDRLGSIDSAARKSVSKFSTQTYWGSFLTPESYLAWKTESDRYEAQYYEVRDEIGENWDQIVFEVADAHRANAKAAYRREKAHEEMTGKSSRVVAQYTEWEFVGRYVDAILEAIPSREEVIDSFSYDVDLSYIPLPSLLAEDQAKADLELERSYNERRQMDAERRMREEVLRNYKNRMDELVVDHLRRMVGQLNDVLYQAANDVLSTTQNNDRLHPRSVVQLRQAIDRVKMMNLLDYDDIEKMVNQAESILGVPADSRSTDQVVSKLQDIATVTRSTLVNLGERPSRAKRELSVSEVPAIDDVRGARQRLGLAEVEVIGETRKGRVG